MPIKFDEFGNTIYADSAANACPTDPQDALQCDSCQ